MGPGPGTGSSRLTSRGVIGKASLAVSEAEAIGARNTGARSGFGVPMGPGGAGHAERERDREVSLVEDDDLWAEDEEVAPSVIGDSE